MTTVDDSFISDEEEEYCPLCVEEMDISDKNFKPCPCGYQICQFCYNNIKSIPELNGRCPGCRRLYDDASVEYKTITPEEYKLQQMRKEKRERGRKQREKEKKENELANKKHLAGIRVVQKNLVYVTGLNPPCPPEDLHSVLRSDKYFGQYGKISKIVINKKTPNPASASHHHQNPGLVVYVTFAKKEDALKCINELDGSLCDGRVLRAAHGTTKYCSSYLRGHPCQNPNCMFLHEPGEEADSYTRKDLSTQQGIKMGMMGLSGSRASSHSNIAGQVALSDGHHTGEEDNISTPSSVHAVTRVLTNELDKDTAPVLPATAHWAKSSSNASSPAVNGNVALTNASAFPALSEIFRDQKQQARKEQKQKIKIKTRDAEEPDEYEDSAVQFLEDLTDGLRNVTENRETLTVSLDEAWEKSSGSILPLFAFNYKAPLMATRPEDDKILARKVIERFMLRPIKNYHLAYQNHPIIQQQALLQQQQQQQQQQQRPNVSSAQLQSLQADQQRKVLEQQQLQQGNESTLQQQQQQLLLLQQLQKQQQAQKQVPGPAQAILQGQQENSGASVPPPPGLVASKPSGVEGLTQSSQFVSAANGTSSSSQLLTQLMSGKR